jgi:hypothetical protein
MRDGLPVALVNGVNNLGAIALVEKLSESDIKVVAVGDFDARMSTLSKVVFRSDLPGNIDDVDYIFDYDFNETLWDVSLSKNIRLAIIGSNRSDELVSGRLVSGANWRIVRIHGVLGRGDNLDSDNLEVGFCLRAMYQAVKNVNLVLPSRNSKIRLLGEESATDVVMRAMFSSGTVNKTFDIWGELVDVVDLAKWLIDEAKMTRNKVAEDVDLMQNLPETEEVERGWMDLKWRPGDDLQDSIQKVLKNIFAKVDVENRTKKESQKVTIVDFPKTELVEKKEPSSKLFEVMVENMDRMDETVETPPELTTVTPEVEIKKTEIIEEEPKALDIVEPEIKPIKSPELIPFSVKNSNSRLLRVKENVIETAMPQNLPKIVESYQEEIPEAKQVVVDKPKKKKLLENFRWGQISKWIGLSVAIIFILMVGVWGWSNFAIVKNVLAIRTKIETKNYQEAMELADKTLEKVRNDELLVEKWGWNQLILGRRYQDVLRVVEQGIRVEKGVAVLAESGEKINNGVFKDKEIDWGKELEILKNELAELRSTLSLLSARMSGDWTWIPSRWKGKFGETRQQVESANQLATAMEKVMDFLPEILGTDGKRREYMVLLQNESELRPGGGFIGSYGILSFEKGKLLNFDIRNIYEADGQLKGHVEPPEAIKNFLGEAKWYMRDANWQADFGTSAKDIQWFLEKETGRKVDGVIGVNLAVARAILGVTGEIYVPDFKEKINKNNIYEQAEFYSETNSFAGSNQKASFLGGMGRQMFEEIKNLKSEQRYQMAVAIYEMLNKNEMQISLNEATSAKIVADLGWDGSIYEGKCAMERCFADYLYIVEANLGVNKANYFLYRSIDQTIDIGTQTLGRVVKISYENTAKNNSWPGGDYKNYMRVYIPASSNLAEVSVTDMGVNGLKTIYSGDNLKVALNKGKKEIGFLVEVPAGKKRVVELRYVDQIDLTNKDKFSYLHYIQRQSGFGDTGLVTLVTMPNEWQVGQVEPAASLVGGKLLFNQKLDRDIKMGVEITK